MVVRFESDRGPVAQRSEQRTHNPRRTRRRWTTITDESRRSRQAMRFCAALGRSAPAWLREPVSGRLGQEWARGRAVLGGPTEGAPGSTRARTSPLPRRRRSWLPESRVPELVTSDRALGSIPAAEGVGALSARGAGAAGLGSTLVPSAGRLSGQRLSSHRRAVPKPHPSPLVRRPAPSVEISRRLRSGTYV